MPGFILYLEKGFFAKKQRLKNRKGKVIFGEMAELKFLQNPITSRQNTTVKRICALLEKKERKATRLFRFDGIKLLSEAVEKGAKIEYVAISEGVDQRKAQKIGELIECGALDKRCVICVSEAVFEKMSEESSPEGIITVAQFLSDVHHDIASPEEYFIDGAKRILIVESLRDPGNVGTVIRSSFALGIDRLIISDDCADLYNPKTVRAAMGALFSLEIDVVRASELPSLIFKLRSLGRRIYATALCEGALEIGKFEMTAQDAFVIGNEGHGLTKETIEASNGTAIIPMTEGSESLNAAAAAAICIWETVRQK